MSYFLLITYHRDEQWMIQSMFASENLEGGGEQSVPGYGMDEIFTPLCIKGELFLSCLSARSACRVMRKV